MENKNINCHGYEFFIQESDEGYTINIKGDKEKIKEKLELIEAYLNYRDKAKAAGLHCHPHKLWKHSFFKHMHEHMKAMHHEKNNKCDLNLKK